MRIKKGIVLIIILMLTVSIVACTKKNTNRDSIARTEFLMDTVMTVKIFDSQDEKILDEVFERLEDIEKKMSFTIESSDVSYINNNAGLQPIRVSDETYYVLQEAKRFAELSSGSYDPTIGPLVDLWDIKAEEKERDWIPAPDEIRESKSLVDYTRLELLGDNQVLLKDKDMKINLGGIVKGYATDVVRDILISHGVRSAIIDLGGNVFAHGTKEKDTSWSIGMQNPLEYTGNYLGILKVEDKSVVTSGDYERFFIYNGDKYHHIFDAKDGYPVNNEITGITIISDTSLDGDALSTAVFVLGLEKGMELSNSLNGVDAIFITKEKEVYVPKNLLKDFTLREGLMGFKIKEY